MNGQGIAHAVPLDHDRQYVTSRALSIFAGIIPQAIIGLSLYNEVGGRVGYGGLEDYNAGKVKQPGVAIRGNAKTATQIRSQGRIE